MRVLITDIGRYNPSGSVTNTIEHICASLMQTGIVPAESTFIEHYEGNHLSSHSFDVVSFERSGSPIWRAVDLQTILDLLDCGEKELCRLTVTNPRLMREIDRLRYQINPMDDFLYRENSKVIRRRFEIESKRVTTETILALIERGAKEQDIVKLLKDDLSVFGDVYARPSEEYICFSEFPIASGRVDFVVFTGRSRMDIFLIEAKGANFNLVNQGGYAAFSSKVEQAAGQLRDRLRHIYYNYDEFRKEFHKIRSEVESGKVVYNSFIGPKGKLMVDPKKDINIYPVLIAGRTMDDLQESRKRQDYEYNTKPSLKIETWDTWLRKLSR